MMFKGDMRLPHVSTPTIGHKFAIAGLVCVRRRWPGWDWVGAGL